MLQISNTSDVCISHCSVLQGDGARWRWGVEGNGRVGDGGTAGDGDATRHDDTTVDGPHAGARSFSGVGARSFYSHRIDGPVGRGKRTSCGRDRNVTWTRCVRTRP